MRKAALNRALHFVKFEPLGELGVRYEVLVDLTLALEDALLLAESGGERLAADGHVGMELDGEEEHKVLLELRAGRRLHGRLGREKTLELFASVVLLLLRQRVFVRRVLQVLLHLGRDSLKDRDT